jgi:hypothetical protein
VSTPEGKIKAGIKARLDALGLWRAGAPRPAGGVRGWYFMPVNNGMGVSGIPDFLGSIVTRSSVPLPFAIEAKRPGGTPTERQLDRHAEMKAAGFLVLVVDDVNQLAAIERYMHG